MAKEEPTYPINSELAELRRLIEISITESKKLTNELEDYRNFMEPIHWETRNKVFINYALNGMNLQEAYDLAMCRMFRLANKSLGWEKPPVFLIEKINDYAEKKEQTEE
tara:strand:+ start:782 stop:1108 length:327 start_codon:yes stop_codon:yes gene_type:complete